MNYPFRSGLLGRMAAAAILSMAAVVLCTPHVSIRPQTITKVESPRPEKMISPKDNFLAPSHALDVAVSEYITSVDKQLPQFIPGCTGENQFLHKYPHDCQDPPTASQTHLTVGLFYGRNTFYSYT